MPYLDEATALPVMQPPAVQSPTCEEVAFDSGFDMLDPKVFDYVIAAQPRFDLLRQSAAQLAGLLVLAAAGGRCDGGHPMLACAREAFGSASDATLGIVPPSGAKHHHHHMIAVVGNMKQAFAAMPAALASRDRTSVDAAYLPLSAAFRQLQQASRCLPGFEVVDFGQGCCAGHAGNRRAKQFEMKR